MCQNGVCTISVQRSIQATIIEQPTRSALALNALFSFENVDRNGNALCLGETVLRANEVNPFMTALRRAGITVTALHNHWLFEQPRLMFMHWQAFMNPETFARASAAAFSSVGGP